MAHEEGIYSYMRGKDGCHAPVTQWRADNIRPYVGMDVCFVRLLHQNRNINFTFQRICFIINQSAKSGKYVSI